MSQAEAEPAVLSATVYDVRYVAALFRSVSFSDRATVQLGPRGFCIVVEEARTLLATAYISTGIFDEWNYNAPPDVDDADESYPYGFQIKLNTLIECMNVFGTAGSTGAGSAGGARGFGKRPNRRWKRAGERSNSGEDEDREERGSVGIGSGGDKKTSMRMSYAGVGHPLVLIIAEETGGPTTACEVTTYEPEPMLSLPFDDPVTNVILKSSWLREALSELDPSCEKLTFICNPAPTVVIRAPRMNAKPFFRILATGAFGSTEMDYPNDREVLETFECDYSISFTYRFSHITRIVRALSTSTKTSIRMNGDGVLAMQLMLPSSSARDCAPEFVDFKCLALDDDI